MTKTHTALWLALALAAPVSAHAEDSAADEQETNQIVVTATGRSAASSSTKTDTPIIESAQTISIISRDEIELRAASTIADALSYSAGVQAEPVGIDSRTDEVSVRGFSAGGFSSNNNYVDGLRLPQGGQWTRFGFDPFGIEQIEVLKGPSSVLYGQTAPGGIVNMVSKRPHDTFGAEVTVQAQGYTDLDNFSGRIGADITGPLDKNGDISARLVGLAHHGGSQVDDVTNSRYYVSPSLTWKPGANTTWTLLGQYQRDSGGATYQFLPMTGTLVPTNGKYIENDANLGEPDWNTFDRDQMLIGSFFAHEFSPAITLRNNARYTHVETLYRVTVLSGDTITDCTGIGAECIPGQTIGRRAVQGDGESDGFAIDTQLEARFDTGALSHTLLAGVDYFHTEWEHYRDLVSQPGLPPGQVDRLWNIFDPEPRGTSQYEANLNPQIYGSALSKQTGVYLQEQLAVGGLRLTLGGRYDWSDDTNTNLISTRTYSTDAEAFTWRAGAVYLFDNGLAPYASYSESFQPMLVDPSSTLGGVLFDPTTGQQWEAGLRYQGGHGIYLTAGAYQITQQNVATPDPDGTLCGTSVCQVQTGETRVRGLEFEGRASLASGTTVIGSISHQDAEVTKANTPIVGNNVAAVPELLASVFLDQRISGGPLAGFGFGGGARYTGKSFGDTNNVYRIGDYMLFDLFLRYDFGIAKEELDGLSLSLNARNLADKRVLATCSSPASCFYGQGRVVTARLSYKW